MRYPRNRAMDVVQGGEAGGHGRVQHDAPDRLPDLATGRRRSAVFRAELPAARMLCDARRSRLQLANEHLLAKISFGTP